MSPNIVDLVRDMRGQAFHNYIIPGLTSSLLNFGKVRIFEASRHQHGEITPHSHRFNLACCVLKGFVENSIWLPLSDEELDTVDAASIDQFALVEVAGNFEDGYRTVEVLRNKYRKFSRDYVAGDWYYMSHSDIHSISFSRGSIVLFLEGPPCTDTTRALFPVNHDGSVANTLAIQPWMFMPGEPL